MRRRFAILALALALLCLSCSDGRSCLGPPTLSAGTAQLEVGPVAVEVCLAMTTAQRAQGLADLGWLAPNEGMLFVYRDARPRQFWMRDCLIALDIAFLDASGRVLHVDTMQPPTGSGAPIPRTRRSAPSAYVLEVPGGFFERHGLGAGTLVTIPAAVRREDAD